MKSANGTLTYQLGSRNANTTLRLKDGETQVLAGLISDQDRNSASKIPGLGDIPLLGHLFSTQRDDKNKSEIVLLITPHILRNLERPELAEGEFFAGTEAAASDQPLRILPAAAGMGGRPAGIRLRATRPPVMPPVLRPPAAQINGVEMPEPPQSPPAADEP